MVAVKWQMASSHKLSQQRREREKDRERKMWDGLGFSSNADKRPEERSLHHSCSNGAAGAIPFQWATEFWIVYWPPFSQSEPRVLTESPKPRERERDKG
jgi:hypothetical protein